MAYFLWNDELDIQVDNMNEQHKTLIGLMNKVYDLNANGATKTELTNALNKLDSYTRFHFQDEERHMKLINYDGMERHKLIHKNLLAELEKHIEDFTKHHNGLSNDFFYFLRYWLSTHIRHIDRKYGGTQPQLKIAS